MVVKPKNHTIFSLVVFLLICYSLIALFLYYFGRSNFATYFYYFAIPFLAVLAFSITVRLFLNYKVITTAKGKIIVSKPFLFMKLKFDLSELSDYQEVIVKTLNTQHKELKFRFKSRVFKVSNQEYHNYESFKSYLDKNVPKKMKK